MFDIGACAGIVALIVSAVVSATLLVAGRVLSSPSAVRETTLTKTER
jgi:hypothetical protein